MQKSPSTLVWDAWDASFCIFICLNANPEIVFLQKTTWRRRMPQVAGKCHQLWAWFSKPKKHLKKNRPCRRAKTHKIGPKEVLQPCQNDPLARAELAETFVNIG